VCKTLRPKVHPEKNFALLSQMLQGTGVTHVPSAREEKCTELHWKDHLVASTLIHVKIQEHNHG